MVDSSFKFEYYARMALPGLGTLMFFLLSLAPIGLAGMGDFPPDIILISIYYWTIFRPAAIPFWLVFLLGILRDALFGIALGMSSLIFIFFRLLVLSQQRYLVKETFWAMWVGFGLIIVPVLFAQWALASAYEKELLRPGASFMQWCFTFGLYPLLHVAFNALYRFLPDNTMSNVRRPGGTKRKAHKTHTKRS